MKHKWREAEKDIYLPKSSPVVIDVPRYKFITISGEGNPNSEAFSECVQALYSTAYPIKMHFRVSNDFVVYPLEGVWGVNDEAKKTFNGTIDKNDLVYTLMIRQPNFVTKEVFESRKKPNVEFTEITDGLSIQMLHLGSYDNEAETFKIMEEFATQQGYKRKHKFHREIYLSDFRRVAQDKLKTVLRFQIQK